MDPCVPTIPSRPQRTCAQPPGGGFLARYRCWTPTGKSIQTRAKERKGLGFQVLFLLKKRKEGGKKIDFFVCLFPSGCYSLVSLSQCPKAILSVYRPSPRASAGLSLGSREGGREIGCVSLKEKPKTMRPHEQARTEFLYLTVNKMTYVRFVFALSPSTRALQTG